MMGEVRVKLKLSNPFDEAFVRIGQRKSVRSCTVDAMVDTGSVRSCIPQAIARKLGITIRGYEMAELADGKAQRVERTDALVFDLNGRSCSEDTLVLGNEVLIGQTVLERLDFLVDCKRRRLIAGHPGQAINKVKQVSSVLPKRR